MADTARGYGLLWRKFFDHAFWKESRIFSRAEAWLDIVFCLARFASSGEVKRGEFRASLNWLASRWSWDKAKVYRFLSQLSAGDDPMLRKVASGGQDVAVYKVCKYDKYQDPKRVAPRYPSEPLDNPLSEPQSEPPKPETNKVVAPPGEPPDKPPSEPPSATNKEIRKQSRELLKGSNTSPGDGRHAGFIAFLFQRHKGILIPKSDHRSLKDLLAATKNNPEFDEPHLEAYWEIFQADSFDSQQGPSLGYFCRRINKFVNTYTHGVTNGTIKESSSARVVRRNNETQRALLSGDPHDATGDSDRPGGPAGKGRPLLPGSE